MQPTIKEHFDFDHVPFRKTIADESLWLPGSKKATVETMTRALKLRQNAVLTGEPGVGKTCVLRAVRHRLADTDLRLTYVHNATLSRRDFYRELCVALDLEAAATVGALFHAVSTHIEKVGRDQFHPVILIDEAHLLREETLEHLHILLNYNFDSEPLMSLVLIGLPQLADTLKLRRHRSLYSRIRHRIELEPMEPADTADYIQFRLEEAGFTGEIFARDAIELIHEASYGRPREIDRICQTALEVAAGNDRSLIERELVGQVLEAQSMHQQLGGGS
ncbi:MAG: ExeA family protein [Bradymonadaceae bacterium]